MFKVERGSPTRPSELLLFHRKRGTPLRNLVFDNIIDQYDDHAFLVSTLTNAVQQRVVKAADEVMTQPVRRIHIREHADFVSVKGGRNMARFEIAPELSRKLLKPYR